MSEPEEGHPERVDLTKGTPAGEESFDPYRFGKPDHPIPAEYAPPGYDGPTIPTTPPPSPYPAPGGYPGAPGGPGGHSGAPGASGNPFGNPPGMPYSGQQPPHGGQQPPYHYPQQTPYGYGAPPPPPYGYPAPRSSNGKAIAALVFGILSIVLCWLSFFDAIFVILGLVFSLVVLKETKVRRPGDGRGLAVAGLVCTIVGALLATLLTVAIVRAADRCNGFETSSSDWQTCIRDNLFK
jgi:hypothetical protein